MAAPASAPTPTTTYPFTYTTYSTSHASSRFTKPTLIPSIFPFSPASSCSANSRAPSAPTSLPSNFPLLAPSGRGAACIISNDVTVNNHAFWDLYACCKGLNLNAFGSPNLCSAQCTVDDQQSWQEVGECLSKRVEVVVCKPRQEEIGKQSPSGTSGTSGSQSRTSSAASASGSAGAGSSGSGSGSGSVAPATGAGNAIGVVHVGGSKVGVVLFAMLAVGSFAGMML